MQCLISVCIEKGIKRGEKDIENETSATKGLNVSNKKTWKNKKVENVTFQVELSNLYHT